MAAFSGNHNFTFLMTPLMKNCLFGRSEGLQIIAFLMSFSGVGFGRPQERDFLKTGSTNKAKGVPKGAQSTPRSQ